jgi:hypothetical protein
LVGATHVSVTDPLVVVLATAVSPVGAAGVPIVVAATAADAAELISGAVAVSTAL